MIEIIPTNTCPVDFPELSRRSDAFRKFATSVHLDIDDAKFAPVLSWPYHVGQWSELESMIKNGEKLPFADTLYYEAHLMVNEPLQIGSYLARAGCHRIIAHVETFIDARSVKEAFSAWRAAGAAQVGLAVLIDTPLSVLDQYVSQCDEILLMSIPRLGKQGAAFDERIFKRIHGLHEKYNDVIIGIDGGVSESNIVQLVQAGARRFGVGSAITKTPEPSSAYEHLLALASDAV